VAQRHFRHSGSPPPSQFAVDVLKIAHDKQKMMVVTSMMSLSTKEFHHGKSYAKTI